jgi:hypothetical protein
MDLAGTQTGCFPSYKRRLCASTHCTSQFGEDCPACKPSGVSLQPQGTSLGENGRVEVVVPAFNLHQMVVLEDGS